MTNNQLNWRALAFFVCILLFIGSSHARLTSSAPWRARSTRGNRPRRAVSPSAGTVTILAQHCPKAHSSECVSSNASRSAVLPRSERVLPWLPLTAKNALASAAATLIVKLALQPFDTIKTLQQLAPPAHSTQARSHSLLTTARAVLRERGVIHGLWAGTLVSTLASAPSNALYFSLFQALKARLVPCVSERWRSLAVALAAVIGNTIAAVLRVPSEVYKQRLQAGVHRTLSEAFSHTLHTEGLLGLYSNGRLLSQIARDVPLAVLTAVFYDALQRMIATRLQSIESKKLKDGLCGATAGGIGAFLTTPMDVVKTRLMVSERYPSLPAAVREIYAQEGLSSFFAGTSSRLLQKVPANGAFFACYEALRYLFGAVDDKTHK